MSLWKRFLVVFVVSSLIGAGFWFFSDSPDWRDIAAAFLYTFSLWYGNFYYSVYLYNKLPELKDTIRRMIYSIAFVFIYTLIVSLLLEAVLFHFESGFKPFLGIYLFAFFVTILISALHGFVLYFQLLKTSIQEQESMKRIQMENELKALSSQVNPHFLFNSLNSLMSLIPENQDLAVQFTQKLSDVYRYVLQSRNKELTTFHDEMEFAGDFIFLMKIRYGDNLIVKQDIHPESFYKKLPVLSMQMLIENATKHNTISGSRTLEVTIKSDQDTLIIQNNKNPKLNRENGTGTGLENIMKRYALFTDSKVVIEDADDFFTIKLPLLEVDEYESINH